MPVHRDPYHHVPFGPIGPGLSRIFQPAQDGTSPAFGNGDDIYLPNLK